MMQTPRSWNIAQGPTGACMGMAQRFDCQSQVNLSLSIDGAILDRSLCAKPTALAGHVQNKMFRPAGYSPEPFK